MQKEEDNQKQVQLAQAVFQALDERFPTARCELNYQNPFQLLIATMLSAQSTDERVNLITESLFRELPTPAHYLALGQAGVEERIKSLGLFRTKAKNIMAVCRILVEQFDSNVPADFETLKQFPGVGRKTASVVVSNAFGIPAMPVDTHVFRVANRIGLTAGRTPGQVETQLKGLLPPESWILTHHLLIFHGRRICTARHPDCAACPIRNLCQEKSSR